MSKARFGVGAFFIVLSAVFFMPLQAQEQTSQASSPSKTLKIEDLITYQSHPDKKRLGHYEFLKRDFLMSVADANRVMSKLHTQAEQLIKSPQINPAPIPAIIHKIWLTNPNNPHDIPEKQLQGLIETCQQFPDYRHILWTNYPEALKPSLKKLGDLKIGIEVRSIEELRDLPGTKIGQAYLRQNIFANATDIIRLQILARDGGIYSDMGWTVFRLANVYDVFDAVMNTEYFDQGIVSHNVIATKANDPVIVTTLEKLQGLTKRGDLDRFLNRFSKEYISAVMLFSGPPMLTAATAAVGGENRRLLLIPGDLEKAFKRRHGNSWLGRGLNGSSTIARADVLQFFDDIGADLPLFIRLRVQFRAWRHQMREKLNF